MVAARIAFRRFLCSVGRNHEFKGADPFIGSWEAPSTPKEAQARLALLRRDYQKKVKELRKVYIKEVEQMRIEKQRKEDARKAALQSANEERKRKKAEAALLRAEEMQLAQQNLRQTILKEKSEKLESWRAKEKRRQEVKKEKDELLRRQSSMWIEENKLESVALVVLVDGESR